MNPRITTLANLMKAKRESTGSGFVLMLGAGASLSSGVPTTEEIMDGLLREYGKDIEGGDIWERFDQLWLRSSDNERKMFLKSYLNCNPSDGYHALAQIIELGYIDLVITFNFDRLLERALDDTGFRDYAAYVLGELKENTIEPLLDSAEPRVKIFKVHGSLWGNTFLFARDEFHDYPEQVKNALLRATSRDIIVCGYAFRDACVVRAFSQKGEGVYWVNPSGAPDILVTTLAARRSKERAITNNDGYSDTFFPALLQELHKENTSSEPPGPRSNPFRFLESYQARDSESFLGREKQVSEVIEKLSPDRPSLLHVLGKRRVGKTSFVRAGLVAALDPEVYFPVYLRCYADIEVVLPDEVCRIMQTERRPLDIPSTLGELAGSTSRHVVLFLDQFERVANRFRNTEDGRRALAALIKQLSGEGVANLTVVFIGQDDGTYPHTLLRMESAQPTTYVDSLEAGRVGAIVRVLASSSARRIESSITKDLKRRYAESEERGQPFTLAHVQAICHLLCDGPCQDWEAYRRIIDQNLAALDLAINDCGVISLVEDLPIEEERILLRNIIKIVSPPSRRRLATLIKQRLLFPTLDRPASGETLQTGVKGDPA